MTIKIYAIGFFNLCLQLENEKLRKNIIVFNNFARSI
mgnify:FL=1